MSRTGNVAHFPSHDDDDNSVWAPYLNSRKGLQQTDQTISQQRGEIHFAFLHFFYFHPKKRRSRRRISSSTTLNCWPVLHDPSNSHPASRVVVVVPIHRIIPVVFRIIETMSCSVSGGFFFSLFFLPFSYSLFLIAFSTVPVPNVFVL